MSDLLTNAALVAAIVLAAGYLVCICVSIPFRGWISHAVRIDAPIRAVWDYGSDSTAANEWSVYFDHITPIEGDGRPPDGTVGAFRICYRNVDESVGTRWSETTEAVEELVHREIHTFDLRNFQFDALARFAEHEVHQDYVEIDEDTTHLTFRSRLRRRPGIFGLLLFPVLKTSYLMLGREAGQQVFVWNLENIAEAVTSRHEGRPYVRPHPWAPTLEWEERPLRWWIRDVVVPAFTRRRAAPKSPGSVRA